MGHYTTDLLHLGPSCETNEEDVWAQTLQNCDAKIYMNGSFALTSINKLLCQAPIYVYDNHNLYFRKHFWSPSKYY
jgi:hypothetical protein